MLYRTVTSLVTLDPVKVWSIIYLLNKLLYPIANRFCFNATTSLSSSLYSIDLLKGEGASNLTVLSGIFLKLNYVCDGGRGRRAVAAEGAGEPLEESRRFPVLSLYSPGVAVRR